MPTHLASDAPEDDSAHRLGLRPLPSTPTFPLYGRGPDFTGDRWMELWNAPPPAPLYEVHLGHGQPVERSKRSSRVLVITVATVIPDEEHHQEHHADPVRDAALSALLYLHHAAPEQLPRQQAVAHLFDLSQRLDVPPWSAATCRISGAPTAVSCYRRGSVWVAGADLGEVAISIFGAGQELQHVNLEPVNSILGQYRTAQ